MKSDSARTDGTKYLPTDVNTTPFTTSREKTFAAATEVRQCSGAGNSTKPVHQGSVNSIRKILIHLSRHLQCQGNGQFSRWHPLRECRANCSLTRTHNSVVLFSLDACDVSNVAAKVRGLSSQSGFMMKSAFMGPV